MKKLKELYHKLIHSHATPEEVAWGFAIGVFIAMTPTLGLHMILAIALCAVLKKNEVATVLGTWVVNPLTIFPCYWLAFKIGLFFLGRPLQQDLTARAIKDIFHLGGKIILPLWIGGIVLGLLSAIPSYFLVLKIYPFLKDRALKKLIHPK